MNKPNDPMQPFDDDIAELFDGQALEVPAAMDDRIRNMAKAELEKDTAVAPHSKSLTSRYAPLFATAAVMVLAVALVPMLVDQSKSPAESSTAAIEPLAVAPAPEASMQSGAAANVTDREQEEERLSAKLEAPVLKQESKAMQAEQGGSAGSLEEIGASNVDEVRKKQSQAAARNELEEVSSKTEDIQRNLSLTAPSDFADAAATLRAPSAISTLNAADSAITEMAQSRPKKKSAIAIKPDGEEDYRLSQEDWLGEINRLFETDKQGKFLYELTLFKKQYPDFDLSKHLPAGALKLDSSVGEQ